MSTVRRQDARIWLKANGEAVIWFGDRPEPPPTPHPAATIPTLPLPPSPQFVRPREEFDELFCRLTGFHPDDVEKDDREDGRWLYIDGQTMFAHKPAVQRQRLSELAGGNWRHAVVGDGHVGWWVKPPNHDLGIVETRLPPTSKQRSMANTETLRSVVSGMIDAALEAGIAATDAVRLGIATTKEVDVLARDHNAEPLDQDELSEIRGYCRAILRSGSTFAAYEIATRAIMAYREAAAELHKLEKDWRKAGVDERQRRLKVRQNAAAKGQETRDQEDGVDNG